MGEAEEGKQRKTGHQDAFKELQRRLIKGTTELHITETAERVNKALQYGDNKLTSERRNAISNLMRGLSGRRKMTALTNEEGVYISDREEVAGVLGEYYVGISEGGVGREHGGGAEARARKWRVIKDYVAQTLLKARWYRGKEITREITQETIREAIRRCKGDTTPGIDGIPKRVYRILRKDLEVPLPLTLQHQVRTGRVPEGQRIGLVTCIPKLGQEPIIEILTPLTMLNERTKIFSMTILITLEDAIKVWI